MFRWFRLFCLVQDFLVHEFATLCLSSLSEDDDCRAKIFDSKGLPPLIQLLSSPDNDVQLNTLEVIYNMVQVSRVQNPVDILGKKYLGIVIGVVKALISK